MDNDRVSFLSSWRYSASAFRGVTCSISRSDDMGKISDITSAAENTLGSINEFGKVYSNNPQLIPYKLPDTVQSTIDTVTKTLGINNPILSNINGTIDGVNSELNKLTTGLYTDLSSKLDLKGVETTVKKANTLLKSIDWLL